jgi:hypothetical protein
MGISPRAMAGHRNRQQSPTSERVAVRLAGNKENRAFISDFSNHPCDLSSDGAFDQVLDLSKLVRKICWIQMMLIGVAHLFVVVARKIPISLSIAQNWAQRPIRKHVGRPRPTPTLRCGTHKHIDKDLHPDGDTHIDSGNGYSIGMHKHVYIRARTIGAQTHDSNS